MRKPMTSGQVLVGWFSLAGVAWIVLVLLLVR